MSEPTTRPRLSLAQKLAYACGNAGQVVGYQLISTSILLLYTPAPDKGEQRMPGVLLGIGTFLILSLLARGADMPFDPWIANKSDRSTHPFGRRRIFMALSVVPLALITGLIFYPPFSGSSLGNVVWLGLLLATYYCLYSVYVAPYLALLPELAGDKDENTVLSTMMAAAALFGGLIVTVVAPVLFLSDADTDRKPLQLMAAVMAAVSLALMLVPVLVIKETELVRRKPGEAATRHLGVFAALRITLREKPFIPYVFGTNLFFFGFTVIQNAQGFYVETLLHRSLKEQGLVVGPLFGVAALAFPVIAFLAKRFGKRNVMVVGCLMLAGFMGIGIPLLQPAPDGGNPLFAGIALFSLCGIPIAMFLALPNSMLADICEANARRTSERREGIFFGAQGFLQKVALGVAQGLVGWSVVAFGASKENPLGVQLTGPLCAVALVLSAVCFWLYPERKVQSEMIALPAQGAAAAPTA